MAKVSQITVPDGTTYDVGVKYPNVSPILSKTFTGVIASEANWANGVFFFGSIKPVSWTGLWSIKYKVYAEAAGQPLSQARATVTINGSQGVHRSYASYNEFANPDYRPCYYHELYRMKQAGFNNDYGHALGLRIYSAWNATTAANARTITIEIYECHNCTFEFYDSMLKYAEIPGTGSTNYDAYTEFNFTDNGLQETGDANDVNYYNREAYPSRKTYTNLYRYQFLLTKDYEYVLPTNAVNNSTATTKAMTTEEFDPFGEIYYWSSTGTASAGGNMPNIYLYRQVMADLRYAFNYAQGTFTARKPVYLVCTPQSNGMAKLYSEPLTQTLPASADGLMYIYLGTMYEDTSPYRVNLSLHHEVFMYIDGEVRAVGPHALTAGDADTVGGHTVGIDVPANAKFTDTTYTPASANPLMDGTAAVGTSTKYAREDHVHPTDTSRVPTSRKVNNKALSADITLSASDVSAVPTTRKVNNKALSSDITLSASDVSAIATSTKGAANGVAELDANGKVPSSQLPSYVDDVLEYSSKSGFPATGETGKIYVDTGTNLTYRWSGSAYVEISQSLALGETSSTAYRGDYGKAAYTHAVTNKGSAFSSGLYKITTNAEGHVTAATAVAKADITALGIPGSDTNTTYSAGTGLSLSGTKFNHSNSVTAGTAGTSSNTSGQTLAVPYVTYDAQGHITATGTHTHTVSVAPSHVARGNDATAAGLDPVTAAYIPTAASNKSFGLPANAITIEYSTNGGSSWSDYGATDAQKVSLFNESRGMNYYLGKASAKADNTVNNRLRITIEPLDRYCSFHGIYVWLSTAGNTVTMDLERSTIGAKDTFTTVFTDQTVAGWSGNNIRYFNYGQFGGGSNQTGNHYKYRITFKQTAVNTNYQSASLNDIRFLGDNLWGVPSDSYLKNMLNNRTAYSADANGNVTFPKEITATDYNGTVNGYSIAASVPSGAKFTDTTYTASKENIGSASAGTAIPADDITSWSAGTAASASVTKGVLTITNGTAPSLSYTAKSIPNISVTSKSVVTGITAG